MRISRTRKTGKQERFVLGENKRKRFLLQNDKDVAEFSARHLSDTRYISKLAARYLEELYGGRDRQVPWEDQRRRCVFASSGMVTYTLRKAWGLNSLLTGVSGSDQNEPEKNRGDHRHHAIDAMVIALSNQAMIQQLSSAAAMGDGRIVGRISSRTAPPPWGAFVDSIRPLFEGINVSHRTDHKLNGALHDDTNYGWRKEGGKDCARLREAVSKAAGHANRIADPKVRETVMKKLAELGGKAEKLATDLPMLITRTGKQVPIKKVRVTVKNKPQVIAEGARRRYVALNANHHVCIFETRSPKGGVVWDSPGVVSRYEAMQQWKHQPIVQRNLAEGEEGRFLFSLMNGDVVEMDDVRAARSLFVVRGISDGEIDFVRHNDARKKDILKKASDLSGEFVRARSIDRLREWNCRKVIIDVLGRIRNAK